MPPARTLTTAAAGSPVTVSRTGKYTETMIPSVDAKLATILAVGDPVAYFVCEDSGISDAWIVDPIVTNMIRGGVPCQVCIFLGRYCVRWGRRQMATLVTVCHRVSPLG